MTIADILNEKFQGKRINVYFSNGQLFLKDCLAVRFYLRMHAISGHLYLDTKSIKGCPLHMDMNISLASTVERELSWKEVTARLLEFRRRGVQYIIYNEKRKGFRRYKVIPLYGVKDPNKKDFDQFLVGQGFTWEKKSYTCIGSMGYYYKKYPL